MLLKQIVRQLDAEMDRLERLREIVAGLQSSLILVPVVPFEAASDAVPDDILSTLRHDAPEPQSVPQPEPVAKKQRKPRKLAAPARPKPPRVLKAVSTLARTLTSTIPAGPVVISPEALARERQKRLTAQAKSTAEQTSEEARPASAPETARTPDALVRHLTQRWLSGSASA